MLLSRLPSDWTATRPSISSGSRGAKRPGGAEAGRLEEAATSQGAHIALSQASLAEATTGAVAATIAVAAAAEGPPRADGADGEAVGLPCRPTMEDDK